VVRAGGRIGGRVREIQERPRPPEPRERLRGRVAARGCGVDGFVEARSGFGEYLRRRQLGPHVDRRRAEAFSQQHEAVARVGRRLADELHPIHAGRHLGIGPLLEPGEDRVGRGPGYGQGGVHARLLDGIAPARVAARQGIGAAVVIVIRRVGDYVDQLVAQQARGGDVAEEGALEVADRAVDE